MLSSQVTITDAVYTGLTEFTNEKTGERVFLHGLAWLGGFKRFRGEDHPLSKLKPGTVLDCRVDVVMSGSSFKMLDGMQFTEKSAPARNGSSAAAAPSK